MLCQVGSQGNPAQGTVYSNVLIPRSTPVNGSNYWPHQVDFYVPAGTILSACVFLHGGGGTKGQFAAQLKVATPGIVNWALLKFWKTIAVFPQGQACLGVVDPQWNPVGADTRQGAQPGTLQQYIGIPTWDNKMFYAGEGDDLDFLKDLATYISTTYGTIGRALVGHSSGGMMAARMWRESPVTYSHYCSTSGPAAIDYLTAPVNPIIRRPMFLQIGDQDTTLGVRDGRAGVGDHFFDQVLLQPYSQVSVCDVAYQQSILAGGTGAPSQHLSGWTDFQQWITADAAPAVSQASGVATPDALGNSAGIVTWTGGTSNQFMLREIVAAAHDIPSHEAAMGASMVNQWFNFILST
jgi:poly(3-hydroxybutyrate) depolymerase